MPPFENTQPMRLFLVDGTGAAVSALFLGLLLPALPIDTGMPPVVLRALAVVALSFALYSLMCFFALNKFRPSALLAIAVANALYAGTTIFLMACHRETLTGWGWGYFLAELVILALLIRLEIGMVRKTKATVTTGFR